MTDFQLRPAEIVNLAGQDVHGRDHISHTQIGTFLACQQKYRWHAEERLSPAVTAAPLQMGRAFAHALETGDPVAGEVTLRREADVEMARAAGSPWIAGPDQRDVDIQATVVREASRAYLLMYGQHRQTREVELRARIRNPVVGGRYSLTHDLLCRVDALDQAGAVIIEDKLVGKIDRRHLAARLKLDRQVTIECYLAWRCLGIDIREVRYRVTLKPSIEQRSGRLLKDGTRKGAETFDEYLDRIGQEYRERPDHYLVEEPVTRTPEDFLRLEQEVWTWVEQIREARRTGVWPRNVAHCSDFSGCAYLALCAREPGAVHQFVEREERLQEAAA